VGSMIEFLLHCLDTMVYLAVSAVCHLDFLQEVLTITFYGLLYDFVLKLTAIGNRGMLGHVAAADLRRGTEGPVECTGGFGVSGDEAFLGVSVFWMGDLYGGTGVCG
jgi:hypothetical protein